LHFTGVNRFVIIVKTDRIVRIRGLGDTVSDGEDANSIGDGVNGPGNVRERNRGGVNREKPCILETSKE
jgi:hypothetical protein